MARAPAIKVRGLRRQLEDMGAWNDRQIPDLVRKKDFYLHNDSRDVYLLRFLDASDCVVPKFMCDDIYGLQGGQDAVERGRWLNYDGDY
jgi:hypothetical protein